MKKVIQMFIFLGIASLMFSACSEKDVDKSSTKQVSLKSLIPSDNIPDGVYYGDLGNATIELTYIDNKLVKRVVNGREEDLNLSPKQIRILGNDLDAISAMKQLEEKCGVPCITSYQIKNQYGQTVWIVEYDYEVPCWYENY